MSGWKKNSTGYWSAADAAFDDGSRRSEVPPYPRRPTRAPAYLPVDETNALLEELEPVSADLKRMRSLLRDAGLSVD